MITASIEYPNFLVLAGEISNRISLLMVDLYTLASIKKQHVLEE